MSLRLSFVLARLFHALVAQSFTLLFRRIVSCYA
jgi:hypothetical protein